MHMTNNILKRFCIFALCGIMCLCAAVPAMAESVEKISLGEIEYFLVETIEESETETPVESFNANGTYRAKVSVYNYDETESIGAVMIMGLFNKTTHELLGVKFAKNAAIAGGDTVELSADIVVTDYTTQTIDSYVWKSAATLKPIGNVAPTAPTDVTVDADKITNSTVELYWTASLDDTDSVAYYNVYRNDKYVGSTLADETTFKDVGIRHNTEVSYTVEAVDAAGAVSEMSSATEEVTTDDIARLWLGGFTEGTVIGTDNYTALNTDANAYNLSVTGVTTGQTMTSNSNDYAMNVLAHASGYEYDTTNHKGITFGGLDFEQPGSRIFLTLDEDFIESIDNDEEIKVIYNYFDSRVIGYGESAFNTYSLLVRYASNATSAEEIVGATGTKLATTYRWKTAINTLPTSNNTSVANNSDTGEYPVFKNRFFDFSTRTTTAAASAEKGNVSAYSMGYPATFSLGSNNTNHADHFDNVIVSKMEIAAADYVPYGAVLDFEDEAETQFVEMLSRDGYNVAEIVDAEATETNETKKAIKLRNATDLYPDNSSKAGQYKYLRVGMSDSYLTSSDNRVIIRVTYLDNVSDETNGEGLTVAYDSTSGSKASQIIKRTGTNTWKTAEFFIEDAALTNALGSLQLGTSSVPGSDWYISRVEVIKR